MRFARELPPKGLGPVGARTVRGTGAVEDDPAFSRLNRCCDLRVALLLSEGQVEQDLSSDDW